MMLLRRTTAPAAHARASWPWLRRRVRVAAALLGTVVGPPRLAAQRAAPRTDGMSQAEALVRTVARHHSDRPLEAIEAAGHALRLLSTPPDGETPDAAGRRAELRVATQADLAMAYVALGRYDSAAIAAGGAHALATHRQDRPGIAHALGSLGALAQRRGDPERAAGRFREALAIQRELGADSAAASSLNYLGFIYATDLADYERALAYQLESLGIRERLGHAGPLATTLNSLGVVYGRLHEYDRAHAYFLRALELYRASGDSGGTARAAATLSNMGDLRLEQGDPHGALAHHRESLRLRTPLGDRWSLSLAHRNVGLALLALGRPAAAHAEIATAMSLGGGTGNRGLAARNLLALAAVERARDRPGRAERAAAEARELALAMGSPELVRRAWESLADAQEADGRPADALASFRRFKVLSDSLLDATMLRRVAALEERQAAERHERQIEQLRHAEAMSGLAARQRAAQRNAVATLALALAAFGAWAYRRRTLEARRAEALSLTDALTGARNRRYVREHVAHELTAGAETAFLLVDVDHFKRVNDTHGHGAGDRLLADLARELARACGPEDTVVRWGGEEFLVVARGASARDAGATAERVREAVAAHVTQLECGAPLRVRCSVGFAVVPQAAGGGRWGWESVVALADHALYAAKQRGRDAWVGYADARPLPRPVTAPAPERIARWLADGSLRRWESGTTTRTAA